MLMTIHRQSSQICTQLLVISNFFISITHRVQFQLPIYAWVWDHALEHGGPTQTTSLKTPPPTAPLLSIAGYTWLDPVQVFCRKLKVL